MSETLLHPQPADAPLRALVIDDDIPVCRLLRGFLENLSLVVDTAATGAEGMELIQPGSHDLILLDLMAPMQDCLRTLREVRRVDSDVFVLVMTGYETIELAVEAMKSGANAYVVKPLSLEELRDLVRRERDRRNLADWALVNWPDGSLRRSSELVTRDPAMLELLRVVRKIAHLPVTVLIQGESGTGKELIARAIHGQRVGKDREFVAVNCAAIPEQLLESELFGYERGAFTGATNRKEGLFEAAGGGTILLDEISEMSVNLQVKLLRVLQERSFRRLGSTREIGVDARIIASTNRDLEDEVEKGRFRKDLFFRINVITLVVPPLRERPDDIELLSFYFLSKYSREFRKAIRGIAPDALQLLQNYSWSGNVRELENVIERAVAVSEHTHIEASDLPETLRPSNESPPDPSQDDTFDMAKERFEKEYLTRILKRAKGNISLAARLTKIARQNLYEKLQKHAIDIEGFRSS